MRRESCTVQARPPQLNEDGMMPDGRGSSLPGGDVHVWTGRLVDHADVTADLLPILDDDERARAGRFSFEEDRRRFILAHGMTRRLLADYLRSDAATLTFARNQHGKPHLASPTNGADLQFSLSHSGHCCMLALRRNHPIGVDVEKLRELPHAADIAQRYFTPGESRALAGLSKAAQRDAFFVLWTHKEAMVKGLGLSLAANLASVEFDLDPVTGPQLVGLGNDRTIAEKWCSRRVDPEAGYVAAVATEHPIRSLALRNWNVD
jgi:4'-phosphopantetheinyl transferase